MIVRRRSLRPLFCLLLVAVGVLTTAVKADDSQSDMDAFVSSIIDNSATPQQVASYIESLSTSELDSFGQLLAAALGVPAGGLDQATDSLAGTLARASSSNKVSLGHTLNTSSLISSSRWYNHATECDDDGSDIDRLFVYGINPSMSRTFRWAAPSSAALTAALIYAYHTGGKPGVQGILSGSELRVCIGDTVVNAFSNETIWGYNYIGKQLKVRQYGSSFAGEAW